MGFCVLHYDKQTGSSPGLSQHIERGCYRDGEWVEYHPTNVDPSRTHLNRELIPGELSRDERISKRIKDAGIKPRKDQVRALTVIMSASAEDMQRIEKEGKLNAWCSSSIKWAQETHGEENVVSAFLHMDETAAHLHLTVVPIVQGISKDQAYRENKAREEAEKGVEQKKKRKYKKKDANAPRLCAADVMARNKLKQYQTTYAAAVETYGLERGIEGSEAKHIDINDWYKSLVPEVKELEAKKTQLTSDVEDLTSTKAKAENALRNAGDAIREVVTDLIPTKARKKVNAAEKKAKDAEGREREAKAGQRKAEAERDAMRKQRDEAKREKDAFVSRYSSDIANVDRKNAHIKALEQERDNIAGMMEDAASIGLSARQTWNLYQGKEVELEGISLPEFKDAPPITPNASDTWRLRFQRQLQILHNKVWRPVRDWVVDARRSMREYLRQQESPTRGRGRGIG